MASRASLRTFDRCKREGKRILYEDSECCARTEAIHDTHAAIVAPIRREDCVGDRRGWRFTYTSFCGFAPGKLHRILKGAKRT